MQTDEEVIRDYKSGQSANKIAIRNGVANGIIVKLLRRNHIPIRPKNYHSFKTETSILTCEDPEKRRQMANIIEREGSSISFNYGRSNRTVVAVTILGADTKTLRFVKTNFGGRIVLDSVGRKMWKVSSCIDVLTFLKQVEPYLTEKKERAKKVIGSCKRIIKKFKSRDKT